MKKTILLIIVFAILGLVFGYLVFGRLAGEYVSIDTIFNQSENVVESFGRRISGLRQMKQNILISGGGGVLIGFIISLIKKK